jgi:hypothetical protein
MVTPDAGHDGSLNDASVDSGSGGAVPGSGGADNAGGMGGSSGLASSGGRSVDASTDADGSTSRDGGGLDRDADATLKDGSANDGRGGSPAEAGALHSISFFNTSGALSLQFEDAYAVMHQADCSDVNFSSPTPDCMIQVLAGSTLQFDSSPFNCQYGDVGLISFALADSTPLSPSDVQLSCTSIGANQVHCSFPVSQIGQVNIIWAPFLPGGAACANRMPGGTSALEHI